MALKLKTAKAYHCGIESEDDGSYAELIGVIDSLPVDWLGTWVIDGVSYSADDTTTFKEKYSGFEVGVCVKIKYQTANDLALKIQSKNPYDCQDATTPSAEEFPSLDVNTMSGASGTIFIFTGDDFPPDSNVTVIVDGEWGGRAAQTDSSGSLTFALASFPESTATSKSTSRAGSTPFVVTIDINGEPSDPVIVQVDESQPMGNAPANYTGPTLPLELAPTAAQMASTQANSTGSMLTLVVVTMALALLTTGVIVGRRELTAARTTE